MKNSKLSDAFIKKSLPFIGGTVLCLLAIVMVFNIGTPVRILTSPFTFLFGIGAYLIYAVIYIVGFVLLLKGKGLKIKEKYKYFALILFFLGLLIFVTSVVHGTDTDTLNNYGEKFNGLNYFSNSNNLNLIKEDLAGGQIGWAFCAVFTGINIGVTYFLAILLILAGLALYFKNQIAKLLKDKKNKTGSSKEESPKKEKKESSFFKNLFNKKKKPRVETYDVMEQARYTEDEFKQANVNNNPISFTDSEPVPEKENTPIRQNNFNVNNTYMNSGMGAFVKAFYQRPGSAPSLNQNNPQPSINEDTVFKKVEPIKEIAPEEVLLKANEEQTKAEQLELDFNAKPELNEKMVMAKPIFEEVEPKKEEKPMVTTSALQENKPKKPIKWVAPSSELLEVADTAEADELNQKTAEQRILAINEVFQNFNIGATVVNATIGPSVTRYNVKYDAHVSSRSVGNLVDDISIRLGGIPARFEAIVEGSYYSGLEIPNAKTSTVSFKEIYDALPDVKKHPLAVGFGKNISGDVIYADFNEFPHILVAGTTGSGKSIFIHSIITTLIMRNSPEFLRMALIDPKQVEMVRYRDMPHLLCPIITEAKKAAVFMKKLVDEMNDRYVKFADAEGATSLDEYNEYASEHGLDKLPYIVVIVDEFGDLVKTAKEIAEPILILGQKARACGIHMLLSTQSPTSDIVTGPIKSNLPTHVALCTANTTQSVTILGEGGAEKLLGRGDMLIQSPLVSRVGLVRAQGCFVQKKETSRVIGYLKEHYETIYDEKYLNLEEQSEIEGQAMAMSGTIAASSDAQEERRYQDIKSWVMANQYMSMSRIQGECAVGFNRARRFFTRLQQEGVVALETEGNKGCRVLIHDDYSDTVVTSDELTSY